MSPSRALYSLLMPHSVKKSPRVSGRSRISSKHQITIPIGAFSEAGLRDGDVVEVRADGPGRVLVTRPEALLDELAGCLHSGGELGRGLRAQRQQWG